MLDKLYITPRQWLQILRWSLYIALYLLTMMLQTVVLGNRTVFGTHLDLLPVCLTCVCLREGPQRGGLFVLLASLVWCLSGADLGSISIVVLTVLPIFGSILCRAVLANRFLPALLCCFITLLSHQALSFLFNLFFGQLSAALFLEQVVPCVLISILTQPVFYGLVKWIARIGASYEST